MYGVRHAIRDVAMGMGGIAMVFSVVFFLFLMVGGALTRNMYIGLFTGFLLPLLFLLGGITFGVGWLIGRRIKG